MKNKLAVLFIFTLVPTSQLSSTLGSVSTKTEALAVAALMTGVTLCLVLLGLGPVQSFKWKSRGLSGHETRHTVKSSEFNAWFRAFSTLLKWLIISLWRSSKSLTWKETAMCTLSVKDLHGLQSSPKHLRIRIVCTNRNAVLSTRGGAGGIAPVARVWWVGC